MVAAFAACIGYLFTARKPVRKFDALLQTAQLLRRELAEHSHRVLALDIKTWMHHAVGKLARGREYQQASSVDIQPPDGNPLRAAQPRQMTEYGITAIRIVVRDDFSFGFVIKQHPHGAACRRKPQHPAVHGDTVMAADARAYGGGNAVDRDAPRADPILHQAARTHARLRQDLVQLLTLLDGNRCRAARPGLARRGAGFA
jgi:hypothetical protein